MKESVYPEPVTTAQDTTPHNFQDRLAKLETEHKQMVNTQAEIRAEIIESRKASRQETDELKDRMTGLEGRMTGLEDRMTGLESRMTGIEAQMVTHKDMIAFQEAAHRRETRLLFWIVGTGAVLLIAILGTFFAPQHHRSAQHGLEPVTTEAEIAISHDKHRPRET